MTSTLRWPRVIGQNNHMSSDKSFQGSKIRQSSQKGRSLGRNRYPWSNTLVGYWGHVVQVTTLRLSQHLVLMDVNYHRSDQREDRTASPWCLGMHIRPPKVTPSLTRVPQYLRIHISPVPYCRYYTTLVHTLILPIPLSKMYCKISCHSYSIGTFPGFIKQACTSVPPVIPYSCIRAWWERAFLALMLFRNGAYQFLSCIDINSFMVMSQLEMS